jgi:lysophospholipase L1-like esterase
VTTPSPDAAAGAPRWSRFVAIGDSFTEGLWDVPDPDGECRGWADLLAVNLSERRTAAGAGPLEYANLAVRGRLLRPILVEQLPAALALGPDLVSLVGGGNDVLRASVDIDRLARNLEAGVARLRRAGVDVLLATGMDTADSPIIRTTRGRIGVYNAHIWSIARRHGAHVLDLWGMRSLRDWRLWAPDRIHLTTEGHARVAQAALVALDLTPDCADWDDPLAALPPVPRIRQLREDARWVREDVYPWATRRLRGQSSGATRVAKRPELAPVE